MSRIACLLVHNFPIAAAIRVNPDLRERKFAIINGHGPYAELEYASEAALRMGIQVGMTVAQASAVAVDLTVMSRSQAAEQSAASALIDVAESFSPAVEDNAPGLVHLDLAGMARMFGSESEIAAKLKRSVGFVGMEASIGIACNKKIAWLAARSGGIRIIPAGREREFLDWLPLDLLRTDAELQTAISRWGIRRLGELARIDPRELGTRLGRAGVELARIARGEDSAPLVPLHRSEKFTERIDLEYGIDLLEPLGFVIRPMLDRLIARLALRGFTAGDIVLSLGLADRRRCERRIAVAAATNDIRSLLALINLGLEGSPPEAAIESIQLTIQPRAPRPAQTDMFLPPAPAPDRLQTMLARLSALCGPDRVGILSPANSHRPEAVTCHEFASPPSLLNPPQPEMKNVIAMVLRAIRPAREIEVMCERGEPQFVRGCDIAARVISIAGPWRRQGEWWSDTSFVRDYYEMALADGGVYRMYRDLTSTRWFVDGVYD
jgi:protein ImuB